MGKGKALNKQEPFGKTDHDLLSYLNRLLEPRPIASRSKADWLKQRPLIRSGILECLGLNPLPDRLPLKAHSSLVFERNGYTVERTFWQTWPRVWASGWLIRPSIPDVRVPAVIIPMRRNDGEPPDGSTFDRAISLVRRGYLVLMVDAFSAFDFRIGLTPLTLSTYHLIRALDYLQSLPLVDRDRIGLLAEGDETLQGMFLVAVDDRIRAMSLVSPKGYFRKWLATPVKSLDAEIVPGILSIADTTLLLGMFAPRALQVIVGRESEDTFSCDEEQGELHSLYSVWLQPDRLEYLSSADEDTVWQPVHEATYAWFERELKGNRNAGLASIVEDKPLLPSGDLHDIAPSPVEDRGIEGILEWYHRRAIAQPPQIESRVSRKAYQDRLRTAIRGVIGEPAERVILRTKWHPHDTAFETQSSLEGTQVVSFRSEVDVRVRAVWMPGTRGLPHPTLLALSAQGIDNVANSPIIQSFREAGWAVLCPEQRLNDDLRKEWFSVMTEAGRPEAGMAVDDALACMDWLYGRPDVDSRSIAILGTGPLGVVSLIVTALDSRVVATIADCCGTTYRDGGDELPVIPNVLRFADVPQIASLVAPRPLWLFRVPEDRVGFSSRRYYDWTRRTFQSLGEPDALKMSVAGLPDPVQLREWLLKRIRRANR